LNFETLTSWSNENNNTPLLSSKGNFSANNQRLGEPFSQGGAFPHLITLPCFGKSHRRWSAPEVNAGLLCWRTVLLLSKKKDQTRCIYPVSQRNAFILLSDPACVP
jgi:hypothetical protein